MVNKYSKPILIPFFWSAIHERIIDSYDIELLVQAIFHSYSGRSHFGDVGWIVETEASLTRSSFNHLLVYLILLNLVGLGVHQLNDIIRADCCFWLPRDFFRGYLAIGEGTFWDLLRLLKTKTLIPCLVFRINNVGIVTSLFGKWEKDTRIVMLNSFNGRMALQYDHSIIKNIKHNNSHQLHHRTPITLTSRNYHK